MSNFIDLTGRVFDRLTVISRIKTDKNRKTIWLCRCSCGNEVVIRGDHLKSGHTKSCGCLLNETTKTANLKHGLYKDLTGQVFGRLTVISSAKKDKNGNSMWLCRCICGKEVIIRGCNLRDGSTKSCGCLRKELSASRRTHGVKSLIRHGVNNTDTRLYKVWLSMRNRCNNTKNPGYSLYGARGISICPEWDDPENFIQWSESNGYKQGLQIDRIDSDNGYSPDNCRFVTGTKNIRNRRTTIKVGEFTLAGACEGLGICST